MDRLQEQHAAWLARTFGRTDYLPVTREDAVALAQAGVMTDKYKGTHLFKEGQDSTAAYVVHSGEVELQDDWRIQESHHPPWFRCGRR